MYAFHICKTLLSSKNDDWFILECWLFGCKLAKLYLKETIFAWWKNLPFHLRDVCFSYCKTLLSSKMIIDSSLNVINLDVNLPNFIWRRQIQEGKKRWEEKRKDVMYAFKLLISCDYIQTIIGQWSYKTRFNYHMYIRGWMLSCDYIQLS
jgi:hypothetical protein